jgi:hypothetical protein
VPRAVAAHALPAARVGYCPLTNGADLMLYDPALEGVGPDGSSQKLAIDSGLAHPEVPLVLDSDDPNYPQASLDAICAAVPGAEVAAREPNALPGPDRSVAQSR